MKSHTTIDYLSINKNLIFVKITNSFHTQLGKLTFDSQV